MERRAAGLKVWTGLSEPVLEPSVDVAVFWETFLAAAKTLRVVALTFLEHALIRLDARQVNAIREAAHSIGVATPFQTFLTHRVGLAPAEDELWAAIDRKHRNVIRKAITLGVTGGLDDSLTSAEHASLSDATFARSRHAGPSEAYFARLFEGGRREGWGSTYVARDGDGAIAASAFIMSSETRGVYLHGASASGAPTGAMALLQWRIMQDLRRRGLAEYDLGGAAAPGPGESTKAAGIRRFKERFGGDVQEWPAVEIVLSPVPFAALRAARRFVNAVQDRLAPR